MGLRHLPVVNAVGEVSGLGGGSSGPGGLSSVYPLDAAFPCTHQSSRGRPVSCLPFFMPVLVLAPSVSSLPHSVSLGSCLLWAFVALVEGKVGCAEGLKTAPPVIIFVGFPIISGLLF